MKEVVLGLVLVVLAACAHAHQELGRSDLIAMKKQGIAEPEILRKAQSDDVELTLSSDDVVSLVDAGFSHETINALLARAKEGHGHSHKH